MMRRDRVGAAGAVAVAGSAVAISCLAGAWLCGDARQLAAHPEPASVLLAVTELVTAALLARCGLGALLALVAVALKGPASTYRAALRITPGLLRPALSGLLTLSVSTAVAAAALAAERPPGLPTASWSTSEAPGPPPHDGTTPSAMSLPGPGWVPAAPRPVRAPTPGRLLTGVPLRDPAPPGVVVHRGDTLWSIVARALGPRAGDARVAAEWPRWYAANRAAIGSDPDLLHPGTILHAPQAAGR